MMDILVNWLENDQTVTNTVVIALSFIVLLIVILCFAAFFQGRSIEFWPPKIGERPARTSALNPTDRFVVVAYFFISTLLLSLLLSARSGISRQSNSPGAVSNSHLYSIGQVSIESNAGFQNSGIYLKAGEKVILDPDGRISLAMLQNGTYVKLAKAITAYNLPQTEAYRDYKQTYLTLLNPDQTPFQGSLNNVDDLRSLTGGEVFRRDWIGVDGEKIDSRDLNPCLLFQGNASQGGNWGVLLAQVLANPGSAVTDPFEVLQENGLTPSDLVPISTQDYVFEATQDGWLTFIINDAVLSSDGSPERMSCVDYRQALRKASDILKFQGDSFRIPERSIPLTWYSDNLGSFHVIVKPLDQRSPA